MRIHTIAALLGGVCFAASGATDSYTDFDPAAGYTPVIGGSTPLSYNDAKFTVPQFNPSLGTLTGISWEANGYFSGSVTLTDTSGSANSGTIKFGSLLESEASVLTTLGVFFSLTPQSPSTSYSIAANGTTTLPLVPPANFSDGDSGTIAPAFWAMWTGAGTVDLQFDHLTQTTITAGGNFTATYSAAGRGDFTINYTYTPPPSEVPEGQTAIIGAMALVSTGVLAYRRSRRA